MSQSHVPGIIPKMLSAAFEKKGVFTLVLSCPSRVFLGFLLVWGLFLVFGLVVCFLFGWVFCGWGVCVWFPKKAI